MRLRGNARRRAATGSMEWARIRFNWAGASSSARETSTGTRVSAKPSATMDRWKIFCRRWRPLPLADLAGRHSLIKIAGFPARNRKRFPLCSAEMFRQHDNLTGVIGIMRQLAVHGLHDRVGFTADGDGARKIAFGEWLERTKKAVPTFLPDLHQLLARRGRLHELRIAIAVGFFAIAGEEIRKTGSHIPSHVLYDNRDRIHLVVQDAHQLVVPDLLDGSLGELSILAENGQGGFHGCGGEFQRHTSLSCNPQRRCIVYHENHNFKLQEQKER